MMISLPNRIAFLNISERLESAAKRPLDKVDDTPLCQLLDTIHDAHLAMTLASEVLSKLRDETGNLLVDGESRRYLKLCAQLDEVASPLRNTQSRELTLPQLRRAIEDARNTAGHVAFVLRALAEGAP